MISGEKSVVGQFDREQLMRFFNKYYVGHNMVISVAGNFDPDQIMAWIEEYFADIPAGEPAQLPEDPVYYPITWKKEKDIEQNHICLAFDCCSNLSEERYVLTVANNIFGGNMNSRLFMKVRDEMGMTYAIYSYGSSFDQAGLFQIYAAMQPSQMQPVMDAIFEEIDRIIEHGVTQKELDIAIQQIQAELILGYESSYNRMNALGKSLLIRGHAIPLEEELERISQVTAEDVRLFFKKYLKKEQCGFAIVGNSIDHEESL